MATTAVSLTTAWVSLGSGPMIVQTQDSREVLLATGVSQPAPTDPGLRLGDDWSTADLSSVTDQVWARSISTTARVVAVGETVAGGSGGLTDAQLRATPVPVTSGDPVSVLSAANSSTANLAGGAAFTGASVEWTTYGSATVTVYSSHVSATNGLSVQQSMDNANWFITDTYTVSAVAKTSVNIPRQGRYFRVVYTNGATLTTTFQLQVFLNAFQSRPVSARPGDAMSIENDFDQAISVQTTYNGVTADLARSVITSTNSLGTGIAAVGLVAQLDDVTPTAVTENQFGNLRIVPSRALLVQPSASPVDSWSYAAAAGGIVNSAVAVTVKAAGAAGVRNYLKSLQLTSDTLGAATEVVVRDGAAGTVLWRTKLQTAAVAPVSVAFDPPLRGTAATLLEVATLTASITGGVYINAQGFVGP